MKILHDHVFWLGAMTAFAMIFCALFVSTVTQKIAFDFSVDELTIQKSDWVRGDRNAKVTIFEYSDIDCPFCSRFHSSMKNVIDKYDGQVNWVYRDFPLKGLHPQATDKAIAADCVGEIAGNEAYWNYLDALFESSAVDEIVAEANNLGIDEEKFDKCRKDPKMAAAVEAEILQGASIGATGTPYSIIVSGDEKISINGAQPEERVIADIDSILAK